MKNTAATVEMQLDYTDVENFATVENFTEDIPLIQTTREIDEETDEFANDEYLDQNARMPVIQFLRGEDGKEACGVFIPKSQLAAAGWFSIDESQLVTYQYNSGGKEEGLLLKSVRTLVSKKSVLFAFDRQASKTEERLVVVGKYDKKVHTNKEKFGTGQTFELLLLDENNFPLHQVPFVTTLKGATQATFIVAWQNLVQKVQDCHAIANKKPSRPRDVRFTNLCVFDFTVTRELAGTNAKSAACKVDSYKSPTQANWSEYFLGRKKDIADGLLNILVPIGELTLPANNSLALAPGKDD
jgi:Family of unknown function (DUF5895)